jgi:membrane fusion protein, multidrug efflux system
MSMLGKLAIVVVVLGAMAFAIIRMRSADQLRSASSPTSPVPVVTAAVEQRDEPIVLTGIGTVQALNTAAINSQVTRSILSKDRRSRRAMSWPR